MHPLIPTPRRCAWAIRALGALATIGAPSAHAHDFWVQPGAYWVQPEALTPLVEVTLVEGDK